MAGPGGTLQHVAARGSMWQHVHSHPTPNLVAASDRRTSGLQGCLWSSLWRCHVVCLSVLCHVCAGSIPADRAVLGADLADPSSFFLSSDMAAPWSADALTRRQEYVTAVPFGLVPTVLKAAGQPLQNDVTVRRRNNPASSQMSGMSAT